MSRVQKQLVEDGKADDDVEFWGSKGADGFRMYLEKRFGSVLAGWRAIDKDKSGRLSFFEFCNACRAMGYHGNLKKLWGQLDSHGSGFVSLMEIDKDVGHYMGTFKVALMKKYGDMLRAWRDAIDVSGNGRIEESEIAQCVEQLELDLDPKRLFRMLKPQGLGLTLMDFDPDAWSRFVSTGPVSPKDDTKMAMDEAQPEKMSEMKASNKIKKLRFGLHTVDGFKQALISRCGSLLGAWREALDLDGNGRITHGEFCQALRNLGFQGDVKGLWRRLDSAGRGYILFGDFDPETDTALTELRTKLTAAHGNLLKAWIVGMDTKRAGMVNEQQFVAACEKLGFSGDPRQLFKAMQPDVSRKFLTLKDFDTQAYQALGRGDFRMLSETSSEYKSPLELSFDERQQAGFFYAIRRSWDAAQREEFAKACKHAVPDRVIDTAEEFEDLCIRKFGSLIAAFRQCLDSDGNGRITFSEFCQALRRLGYAGDFKKLWRQYDADKSGHISLKEIDPTTHKMVTCFLDLLANRYGTLDNAWRDGFGKDPHDSLDEAELKQACKVLEFPYDAKALFKSLQTMPGRQLITIWDLDPECTRKRQRGQVAAFAGAPSSGEEGSPAAAHNASTASLRTMTSAQSSSMLLGTSPAQILRQALKQRYGSVVAAWREALDPKMQGGVSFGKFVLVLEDCAYHGNIKSLWEELACGKAMVSLKDMDADAARLLDKFRNEVLRISGSLLKAWEGLDVEATGRLDEAEFLHGCQELGVQMRHPKKVFKLLLARHGQRSLTRMDLAPLLIGVPPAERAATWAGLAESGPAEAATWEDASAAGAVPESMPLREPLSPSTSKASPRDHAEKVTREHHEQDVVISSLEGFKRMLTTKFGSLFSAWRHCLDQDQNGVVTRSDFASACRHLGVKAVQKLWTELDANGNGQISLKEMDPECGEAFAMLEQLLLQKFGSTKEGWKKHFLSEGTSWCEQLKFVERLQTLGFPGDAEKLYAALKPEPGRRYLTYEDLWLNLDPNSFEYTRAGSGSPTSPSGSYAGSPRQTGSNFNASR